MPVALDTLVGADAIQPLLAELARLRIAVFREWPYLYDGSAAYEQRYLSRFAAAEDAVLVVATAGGTLVGASTGMPLAGEHAEFAVPFAAHGYDVARVFYCAETVLLPQWRGRGLYRDFFVAREAHARRLGGFDWAAFCGVVRPDDHPLRPQGDRPLDPVWRRFGYRPVDGMVTEFPWKDLDRAEETAKPMQFWVKALRADGG